LVPGIRDRATLGAAVVGGVIAVLAVDMPYNLGLVSAAVGGIVAGLVIETRNARARANDTEEQAS
jgi:fructose-specific phosphotransferase system IIC component